MGFCEEKYYLDSLLALVALLDACSTGDQEVVGSISARSGNILLWRLILKYLLLSFSPYH